MPVFPQSPQFDAAIVALNTLSPAYVGTVVRKSLRSGAGVESGKAGADQASAQVAEALAHVRAREDDEDEVGSVSRTDVLTAIAAVEHMVGVALSASLTSEEFATALARDVATLSHDTAATMVHEYSRSFTAGRTRVEQASVVVPRLSSVQSRTSLRLSSSVTSQERAPEVLMSLNVQDPFGPTEQLQLSLDREQLGDMFLQLQAAQEAIDALR